MGASQDKKKRMVNRFEGSDRKQAAEQKEKRRRRIINIAITILVVLLLAAIFVINSNLLVTSTTAVSVGDQNFTAAEYNYFYFNAYYRFLSLYGGDTETLKNSGLDTSKPLEDQKSPMDPNGKETWADYFRNLTLTQLKDMTMLASEANAAGFKMSDESKEAIDNEISTLESSYATYGNYTSAEQFLVAKYGVGSNVDIVRKMMELSQLTSDYYTHLISSYEYTQDELSAYYSEHENEYDIFTFRSYLVSAVADEENGIDQETAMASAKEQAEAIKNGTKSEEDFARLVLENTPENQKSLYEDESKTMSSSVGSSVNTLYSEWMFDKARTEGDVEIFESEGAGYYVIMYVSRDNNDYNMQMVRHILIKAVANEDGEYTDEAKETAKTRAEELLTQFNSGEATEESFAELARENSEDTGSSENGGLYDKIYKGQMVEEFDAFCFDESREPGDTAIVYGESGSYSGYHVMYYVGEADITYADYLADENLRQSDYNTWSTEKLAAITVTPKFSLRFAQ